MPPRVPDDGSVTINLNEPDAPIIPVEQPQRQPGPPYVDRVPLGAAPDAAPPPEDEGPDLEKQLRDMQKREKAAADRAVLERNQRIASEQRAQQTVAQSQVDKETSDYYSVTNALAAKTGEMSQAEADYANAFAAGDTAQVTQINRRMITLEREIAALSEGKQDFENKFEQRKRQPQQRPQPQFQSGAGTGSLQQGPNIEQVLATMPNLLESEKNWARRHPDVVYDGGQFKQLEAAFLASEKRGLERGSPEYFRFFNERLGYDDDDEGGYDDSSPVQAPVRAGTGSQMTQQPMTQPQRHGPVTAAPVSRVAPGPSTRRTSGDSDSQVTLNQQQREAAKFSRLDEKSYARNVARLNDLKRRGYYQETG